MVGQCDEAKQLCLLKDSEIESYEGVKSSLSYQLQLNIKACTHLTEQIMRIQKQGNNNSFLHC